MIDVNRGFVTPIQLENVTVTQDGVTYETTVIVPQPNAGVVTRFTPEGIAVHMYWSEPGHYYGDHGQEFPEAMAVLANYPVEELQRKRKKFEAMALAGATIEKEYATHSMRNIFKTRGDYQMVEIAPGRFIIEFLADGSSMTREPLAKDVALRVFDTLAPLKNKKDTVEAA